MTVHQDRPRLRPPGTPIVRNARGSYAERRLADWRGALQADAFAGFNRLYLDGAIVEVGDWAHERRKFHDLCVKKKTSVNTEALARIAELLAIEAEIRGKPPEARREIRQARAGPLLRDLRTWLETPLATVSMHSDTARAINYAIEPMAGTHALR